MTTPENEKLLTLADTLKVLGISKQTLYRLMERGALKCMKVGRQWRFRQADIDTYLDRGPDAQAMATVPADLVDAELTAIYGQLGEPVPELPGELDPAEEKIIQLAGGIFRLAVNQRSSDIHLEPLRDAGIVRLRIDGVLHELRRMPVEVFRALLLRVKIMGEMSLEAPGLPQDARILCNIAGRSIDFRCSLIPTVFGDSVVLRILDQATVLLGLDQLHFMPDDLERLQGWLRKPNGLVIVTGPTGSGKTTTMYSCVMSLNASACKILSIEDPVEYLLPGVVQSAVNVRNGYLFAYAMRAFLRQDPDVIMVGEVRDRDTLQVAIQAALTGHLLFTSLHTNGSVEALTRMVDIGAEPFLITNSLLGVVAQRLVRVLCPECKQPRTMSTALLTNMAARTKAGGYTIPKDTIFFAPVGCSHCGQSGYRGRTAIYELLEMSPAVNETFLGKAPNAEIVATAVAEGMHTLFADGMRKAAAGITSIEEVMRVLAY